MQSFIKNVDETTQDRARMVRGLTVEMIHTSGGGHFGGALSVVDILTVLFESFIRMPPTDPRSARHARDRFVLSKGHAAPAYYATLAQRGLVEKSKLNAYATHGAALQGHPDMTMEPEVDFSTGSLGQGLSVALGMALALRARHGKAWAVLGDGECQEGQVWEAAMLASRLKLDNLVAVVDVNGRQEWGFRRDGVVLPPVDALTEKWRAFGWAVSCCDGHDHGALEKALQVASKRDGKPGVVLAYTVKGYGSDLIESDPDRFHCDALSDLEYRKVMMEVAQ